MRIQHNIMAMNAYRNLGKNNGALNKNLEKLSSGYRINRAGDDAAGLAISEKMRAQIAGLDQAQKNAQSGINLVQTAEGALTEVHDMLNRMVTLTTQAANGTYSAPDRAKIQSEINALTEEIDRIAENSNFNGTKLLDGSLANTSLSEAPVKMQTVTTAAGVNVDSVNAGKGTKGTFTVDLKTLHGTGDKITFSGADVYGVDFADVELTYDKTATNATHFTGSTLEEQAQSIGKALLMNGDIAAGFDVKVEGTKVTLTALDEGFDAATIKSVTTADKTVTLGTDDVTVGAGATTPADDKAFKGGWQGLLSNDGTTTVNGMNLQAGDELTFNFVGSGGEALTTTIEITQDMLGDGKVSTLTSNLAAALNNASFDDKANTGIDESQIKVSDLFTITGNLGVDATTTDEGSLSVVATNAGANYAVGKAVLTRTDGQSVDFAATTANQAGVSGTGAKAETHVVDAGSENFSDGDVFTIAGKLSDGRDFKVELTAGTDFEIGTDYKESMGNIVAALTGSGPKEATVDVEGKKIAADTIFGADGKGATDGYEFTVKNDAGELTVTSTRTGAEGIKGATSNITDIQVKTAPKADISFTSERAVAKQAATSSLTLDEGIKNQYGTAIKIGDTTYEIVKDARDVSSRNNQAVVVEDLANASVASIVDKLATAVKDADTAGAYEVVEAKGNTLTISTKAKGSDVKAIDISTPYGDEVTTATFKFDTDAVKEGSTMEFNGNTYEFVKAGSKASNGAIAIEVADFDKATAKDLANAFADVAKNGNVSVGDDGTVTLKSTEAEDGTLSAPSISFGKELTLQIGSDAVETIGVSIASMKAEDLGISGLDVGDEKKANASLDKVKAAIEQVSVTRGNLGAVQNRLEHTINNLGVMEENIQDAEANIRDTDIADEMMAYTKNNILIQSAQAMLAQANQAPQGVLQLMG